MGNFKENPKPPCYKIIIIRINNINKYMAIILKDGMSTTTTPIF